ncbi:alpha/beta hydrolase [Fusobacterium necrogenes]|uniref:alpha/beta hydrolase n=1 Tax=Fusobacterium necrogenes TaxID=858 RepID=UPI00255CBEAF|nr:alpha/beta hydrolase [Fusobacterium necrogenes]
MSKKKLFLLSFMILGGVMTMGANYKENPFTLVYEGAITENVKGKINIHPVSYKVNGINIAANVYTPANYNPTKKYPTIVVAHPNGGVKEQVAGLYAQKLAEQGYITIAADAAYQGASGGEPRGTDKPANRINDIHGMADYIVNFPGVDKDNLGLLGICGGGGYSIKAAQTDKRFKAVATISMFNTGIVRKNGYMNSQLDSVQERLQAASDARMREALGGEIEYPTSSFTNMSPEEAAKLTVDLYKEGYEYYAVTHAHPNSSGTNPIDNLIDLAAFDAADNAELINQPLLMIAGDKADSLYMTEEVFKAATGTKNKELYLVKGATHIQTYWKPEYVKEISEKLTSFYNKNIGGK